MTALPSSVSITGICGPGVICMYVAKWRCNACGCLLFLFCFSCTSSSPLIPFPTLLFFLLSSLLVLVSFLFSCFPYSFSSLHPFSFLSFFFLVPFPFTFFLLTSSYSFSFLSLLLHFPTSPSCLLPPLDYFSSPSPSCLILFFSSPI